MDIFYIVAHLPLFFLRFCFIDMYFRKHYLKILLSKGICLIFLFMEKRNRDWIRKSEEIAKSKSEEKTSKNLKIKNALPSHIFSIFLLLILFINAFFRLFFSITNFFFFCQLK